MAHFDDIYELAADNYGLITSAEAKNLGVAKSELNRWVGMGRLLKRGQGVYKLVRYAPTEYDRYAEAVALVGDGSFLFGEAVLAMHGLALANPRRISVGTTKRVRRELPEWVQPVTVSGKTVTSYEGIPSQSLAEAILECRGMVMGERLKSAVEDARREGLITKDEFEHLRKELS
ncbi:type IV toxin-antitoxin system AbiEi family antitoxin domain-containing protein [Adlercreutzia equolifaciens]|uniref:type IV toxin-antitoxin system AbiEi family antitoxin domain-containing protein n=1 Tax=Adlercreutzia equolifaciens TaxID=446660 RepID=UPI0027B8A95F|nr:type IV toxin-antitoxin system AbiEi family antitoxin domain-containing protein [Adlercreutzia equolifaciens]